MFYIAFRYFFSKSKNALVNWISYISLFAITVITATLIIVLSVFNGFEGLVLSLYNSFDPDIKITRLDGNFFESEDVELKLKEFDVVYSKVLEERVLLKYKDREHIAKIKGVDNNFKLVNNIDTMISQGKYFDPSLKQNSAIIGQGISYYLSVGINDFLQQVQVFVPNRKASHLLNPQNAFSQRSIVPVGIFSIQSDFDITYTITSLQFVQELLDLKDELSAIEIKVLKKNITEVQKNIQNTLGNEFLVQNRNQQHQILYQILNSEKLAVFVILLFIFIISAFNIIASLSMMIIDKKQDIISLFNLGLSNNDLKIVFWIKGCLTTLFGSVFGLIIGLTISFAQLKYGFISLGDGSFVVDKYPVLIKFSDIGLIFILTILIGSLASWIASRKVSLD